MGLHKCSLLFVLIDFQLYCNNIAPGETKTCRKIGAYRKKSRLTNESPAQKEYTKVYKRLTARKNRGTMTEEDWNKAIAEALLLKAKAERGEIGDEELRERYKGV